jgi:hypothetical protein
VQHQGYVDPAAKKTSIFTSMDWATDLLSCLSAACMSFDLPLLPSVAGDFMLSIEISLVVAFGLKNGHPKNVTPYNNGQNTSDDNKMNGHAIKSTTRYINQPIPCTSIPWQNGSGRKNPFRMADGRAEWNGMAFS